MGECLYGTTPAVATVEGEESAFVRLRTLNWSRVIAKVWLEDPTLCKRCGKEMAVVAAISSPAQDHVIEKILRARDEWDPPWPRSRPARGPPSGEERSGDLSASLSSRREEIEPEPSNEELWTDETWVDPPHDATTISPSNPCPTPVNPLNRTPASTRLPIYPETIP